MTTLKELKMGLIFSPNNKGDWISMTDFLKLQESVEPKETEYGSDMRGGFKNKEWEHTPNTPFVHTFIRHSHNKHVRVILNKDSGELAFATRHSNQVTDNPYGYSPKRANIEDSLKVFNKVAHVGIEGAKKHNLKHITVSGHDPQLGVLYDKVAKNKFFLDKMKHHGFSYQGKNAENHHVFTRD